MALEAQSIFWIVFAIMLANIAHDMVVCVQQPMFTELFGASYRQRRGRGLSGGSVVGGERYAIAAALVTFSAATGTAWRFICWAGACCRQRRRC
jgi:MHS family shikimate/dehydroshikimate transporter-like MFS transporter